MKMALLALNWRGVILLVVVVGLMGCATGSKRYALPPGFKEARINSEGSIRTYAAYAEALEKEMAAYRQKLKGTPETAAVFVVRELRKLPSHASRRYARELARVLVRHGVQGIDVAGADDGTATVSYDELAKVTALTFLLGGGEDSWDVEMPFDLWRDLLRAVVAYCPCDDAAILTPMASLISVLVGEFTQGGPDAQVRREWKEIIRHALARMLYTRRPFNFTTVSPTIALLDGGEGKFCYMFMVDDLSGEDLTDLYEGTHKAAVRASHLGLTKEDQETLNDWEKRWKEEGAPSRKALEQVDAKLLNMDKFKPALQAFCDALNRHDEQAVRGWVSEDLLKYLSGEGNADLFEKLMGPGHDHITLDYLAPSMNADITMRGVVTGPAGKAGVLFEFKKEPGEERWKVFQIWGLHR